MIKLFNDADYVIMDYILRNEGTNTHKMANILGVSWVHTTRCVKRLAELGVIIKVNSGRENKLYISKDYKKNIIELIALWKNMESIEETLRDKLGFNE